MGWNPGAAEGKTEDTKKGTATGAGEEEHGEVVEDVPAAPLATPWDRTQARQSGAGPALRRFQGKGAATGAGEEEPGEVVDEVLRCAASRATPFTPLATAWVYTQPLQRARNKGHEEEYNNRMRRGAW